jgi:hypothetical protein
MVFPGAAVGDQSLSGRPPDDPFSLRVYGERQVIGDICR